MLHCNNIEKPNNPQVYINIKLVHSPMITKHLHKSITVWIIPAMQVHLIKPKWNMKHFFQK